MKVVLLVSLLFAGLSPELTAQGASLQFSPPASSLLFLAEPREADLAAPTADLDELRPVLAKRADYRWEFGIAGAALLGLAGAVAANAACNPDAASGSCVGPVVGTAAVGALVGGVTGLFIGAGVERRSDVPPEPTGRTAPWRSIGAAASSLEEGEARSSPDS